MSLRSEHVFGSVGQTPFSIVSILSILNDRSRSFPVPMKREESIEKKVHEHIDFLSFGVDELDNGESIGHRRVSTCSS